MNITSYSVFCSPHLCIRQDMANWFSNRKVDKSAIILSKGGYSPGEKRLGEISDDDLVRRVVQRDEQAFLMLYDRYAGRVYGLVLRA